MTTTRHQALSAAAASALAAALLGGCGSTPAASHHPTPSRSTTATRSASPTASSTPKPIPPSTAGKRTTPSQAKIAEKTARRIFAVLSNRNLTASQWWARLSPMLTPTARQAFKGTNPARIPPLTINGPLKALGFGDGGTPGLTQNVRIPTARGNFVMGLLRTSHSAPYKMSGLSFPKGVQ